MMGMIVVLRNGVAVAVVEAEEVQDAVTDVTTTPHLTVLEILDGVNEAVAGPRIQAGKKGPTEEHPRS